MKINEIINEALGRRDLLKGAGAAAGLSTFGYGAYQQKQRPMTDPGASYSRDPVNKPTSAQNSGDMAATQPAQEPVASAPTRVIPKYSPEFLKKFIIDYARQHLPSNQVAPFIAQVSHESASFASLEESLNYSAERLSKKYPKLFPPKLAVRVVASPDRDQIIANTIYANRMGNGDYASGDGYKYRGRGYIQLTGRENYDRMGKLLKIDLVNNPDWATRVDIAAVIAISYWNTRVANKVNTSNIGQVTKKIAGSSTQGIKSRTDKLKKYTQELGGKLAPKKDSK